VSREDGRTVLFVSHDLNAILSTCPRALLVDRGTIVLDGRSPEVVAEYEALHTRSRAQGGTFLRDVPAGAAPLLLEARVESAEGGGHVEHGQPLRLTVATNPAVEARRFGIEVTILDRRQRQIGFFSSGVMQGLYFEAGETAVCEIPFVPYAPGVYSVDLAARIPEIQTFDEWTGEISFDVTRFDPFRIGSTFTADDVTGSLVPEHRWASADPG
jgi:lipopolysaccharide transport system ATP-binding protein